MSDLRTSLARTIRVAYAKASLGEEMGGRYGADKLHPADYAAADAVLAFMRDESP